jgi:hypothetical protein
MKLHHTRRTVTPSSPNPGDLLLLNQQQHLFLTEDTPFMDQFIAAEEGFDQCGHGESLPESIEGSGEMWITGGCTQKYIVQQLEKIIGEVSARTATPHPTLPDNDPPIVDGRGTVERD